MIAKTDLGAQHHHGNDGVGARLFDILRISPSIPGKVASQMVLK